MMTTKQSLPKHDELYGPTLQALQRLGGSGSNEEINDTVVKAIGATPEQLEATYAKSGALIVADKMSWARSFLKMTGYLANPSWGIWVITDSGKSIADKPNGEIKLLVGQAYKAYVAAKKAAQTTETNESGPEGVSDGEVGWSDVLLQKIQTIDPAAFERLCQRLLRESGFTRVEVTGKSADGGIDGAGVLRMNLISFQVLFQCKRWKGSVGSEVVRNFRGAMQGRADKGLIITTGNFTVEARKEATRDGAPAIDLIDGEALCGLLKNLKLGVTIVSKTVEEVSLDAKFFESI